MYQPIGITFTESSAECIRPWRYYISTKVNDKTWKVFRARVDTPIDFDGLLARLRRIGNGTHVYGLSSSFTTKFGSKSASKVYEYFIIIRRNQYTELISIYLLYDIPYEYILDHKKKAKL